MRLYTLGIAGRMSHTLSDLPLIEVIKHTRWFHGEGAVVNSFDVSLSDVETLKQIGIPLVTRLSWAQQLARQDNERR